MNGVNGTWTLLSMYWGAGQLYELTVFFDGSTLAGPAFFLLSMDGFQTRV